MFFLLSFFLLILINRMFNFEKGSPFFIVAAVLTSIFILPIYDLPTHLADMFWLDSISFPIMFMTIMLSAMFSMAYISTPYVVMLILLSILTFTTSNLINFYIFFELNLIPIFIIILGWGYQPERFFATKMMMMYTLVGSLPLFISIICYPWAMNMTVMFLQSSSFSNVFFILLFTNAFLVKLPIFSVHLWLPLAHVEAPLVGSMILAGVLLKLGGYGMIRMALAFMNPVSIFNISMTGFCLIGALIAMIYCSTQVDLKVIIAYSSVAHMSMAAVAVLTLSSSGISAAMINLVVHGFTSSLMFFSAGSMYLFSNSRHILINKGLINITPFFLVPWFSACLMNAGGPPSMNLLSEIMFSFSIINLDSILMFPLAFIIILGMYFNMKIYSITTQGSYPPFFTSKMPMSDSWVMSSLLHVNISLLCLLAIFIMVV